MEIEVIFDRLFDYYNINSMSELAIKIGISQPAISKWKSRNSVNAIKKKCRELGIYQKIFLDSNIQNIQNNSGITAQYNNGKQIQKNNSSDDIDPATYSLFKESYQKAKKNDDLKGFRLHLMDYDV